MNTTLEQQTYKYMYEQRTYTEAFSIAYIRHQEWLGAEVPNKALASGSAGQASGRQNVAVPRATAVVTVTVPDEAGGDDGVPEPTRKKSRKGKTEADGGGDEGKPPRVSAGKPAT